MALSASILALLIVLGFYFLYLCYMEEWRKIKEYPQYEVSNMGNVRNANTGIILKPQKIGSKRTYYKVNLYSNGIKINKYIHRLVAEAFIPNPENKPEINHINTNGFDNKVENLEWCTRRENQNNPLTKINLSKSMIGRVPWGYGLKYSDIHKENISKALKYKYTYDKNPNAKQIVQLSQNGELVGVWKCIKSAVESLNIQQSHISSCCRGKLHSAYGYKWRYLEDQLADWLEEIQDEDTALEKAS